MVRGEGAVVRAIGLAGQMHGVVLCAADGAPLRPAVLWADTRATGGGVAAYERLPAPVRARLANPVTPGMAGPVLHHLFAHEPAVVAAAAWALQPKDCSASA